MGSTVLRGARAAALITVLVAAPAQAQQYEDQAGDLEVEVSVSVTVTISGEGFVSGSVVYVTLTSADGEDVYDLGKLEVDEEGRFFSDVALPEDLEDGRYTIAATGATAVGATRVLTSTIALGSSNLEVLDNEPPSTTSTAASTTTTSSARLDTAGSTSTTAPTPSNGPPPASPVLFIGIGVAGAMALGVGWWWIYRTIRR